MRLKLLSSTGLWLVPDSRLSFGHPLTRVNPTYPGLLAAALYLVGGALQFNTLFRKAGRSVRVLAAIALLAVVCHGVAALTLVRTDLGIDLSLFPMISLTTFILAGVVVLGAARLPLENLFVFVFPFCAVALLVATRYADSAAPIILGKELTAHVLLSIAAYTVLAVAACQSILLQIQERHLRRKRGLTAHRVLPPLESMESLLFQLIWLGFGLLSAAIASGFIYLDDMFARHVAHHTVFALLSWATFGVLLFGRYQLGWRGTPAVRWTLFGFVLLVLGYVGTKVVRELILST